MPIIIVNRIIFVNFPAVVQWVVGASNIFPMHLNEDIYNRLAFSEKQANILFI